MSAGLPQHLTLDYLRALLSRGVEKAAVTEEARTVLRKWVMDARRNRQGGNPLFRFRPLCFRRNAAAAGNSRPAAGLRG